LEDFLASKKNPVAFSVLENQQQYYDSRYQSAINWIKERNHAVISNGPFYLESYSPDARTITIRAFDDATYPFAAGHWIGFEHVSLPKIMKIDMPGEIVKGTTVEIPIQTTDASQIHYFINDAAGDQVDSGILLIQDDRTRIILSDQITSDLGLGGNDLKMYAISDSVLRPDIYTTSFLAVESVGDTTSETIMTQSTEKTQKTENIGILSIMIGALIIGIIMYVRKSRKANSKVAH
jgi:peptide/nickel transport system substrate-binding protein